MNAVRDLRLAKKLMLAFGLALLAVFAMCATLFVNQQSSIAAADVSARADRVLDDVDQALGGIHDQNASNRGLSLYKAPRFVDKYRAAGKLVSGVLNDARQIAQSNALVTGSLDLIAAAVREWQTEIGDRAIELGGSADTLKDSIALTSSDRASVLFNKLRDAVNQARGDIKSWSSVAEAQQVQSDLRVRNILIVGALVVLSLMSAAWLWLTRSIVRPLGALAGAMNGLAAGDTTWRRPWVSSRTARSPGSGWRPRPRRPAG